MSQELEQNVPAEAEVTQTPGGVETAPADAPAEDGGDAATSPVEEEQAA